MKKILLLLLVFSINLFAADTTEPYPYKMMDYEFFLDLSNAKQERFLPNYVIGYGLTEKISPYFSASTFHDHELANNDYCFNFGVFSNVIELGIFQFDLYTDYMFHHTKEYELLWGSELNIDMKNFGIYSRIEQINFEKLDIQNIIGVYVTLFEKYQILLETVNFKEEFDFGVNIAINDNIELITHITTNKDLNAFKGGIGTIMNF